MKKSFLSVLFILMILCGCSGNTPQELKSKGIAFNADINTDKTHYSLNGKINEKGNFSATVVSPESIKGLEVFSDGKTLSFDYMGIKYEKDVSAFPLFCFINVIRNALCKKSTPKAEQEATIKKGIINGTDYTLYYSEKGLPQRLIITDPEITVVFKNVQIKTG